MWHDRNLARLVLARFISRVGGEAAFFVGIWGRAAYDFDAAPGELALLMGVLGVTSLAGSAAAGVLVDRFDPRRVLIAAEALFAPAALALVLPGSMAALTATVAVAGALGAVVLTAIASFPPYLTDDPARLTRVNATVEAAATGAFVVGPGVGAVIARVAGLEWIFVLDAVTSLVAVALATRIAVRPVDRDRRRAPLAELAQGFRFAYTTPPLRFCLLVGLVTWLSFGAFAALEPIYFRDVLGVGPEALGWVNSVFGVGLVAGSALLGRLPSHRVSLTTVAALSVGGGVGAVVYAGTADLRVVVVGAVVWGTVLGTLLPMLRTLAQRGTPDRLLGRTMGVLATHQSVGELLPLTFVPVLAAVWGVQAVLVGCGVALVVLSAACLAPARRLDRAGGGQKATNDSSASVARSLASRPRSETL